MPDSVSRQHYIAINNGANTDRKSAYYELKTGYEAIYIYSLTLDSGRIGRA